ncbi:MAG: gliding motility-associated C-terminal domain-containing protein [Bacteroidia bacterium]
MKKKLFFLCLLVFRSLGFHAQGAPACPSVNAGSPQTICQGACATLNAAVVSNNQTTSYTVSAIPYAPYPFTGSSILVGADDVWSSTVNLGFNFCYFGNWYNQAVLGDNGELTFDLTNSSGYDNYSLSTSLPNTTDLPGNTICAAFRDMDQGIGGNSYITTLGSAPCHALVMSWVNVPLFDKGSGICDGTPNSTVQLVLYENTNYIDVYLQNSYSCSGWNGGAGIIGIQNQTGTVAVVPPGRNYPSAWSAVNEAWRFSPTGAPSYTITWTGPSGVVGSGASVSVCPTTTSTYTATMVVTNCDGATTTYTSTTTVTVNPNTPTTVSPLAPTVCNGAGSVTLNATGSGTFVWSPSTGLSGTTGSSVNASPASTTTYTVTETQGSCTSTATTTVNVGNSATLTNSTTAVSCNGGTNGTGTANATGGTPGYTYSWSGGGGTNPTTVGLPAGTYSCLVTTANGCTSTTTVTITQPIALATTPSSVAATCGSSNGSAGVTASGGNGGYTYAWTPAPAAGQTTATAVNLPAGNYTVTVTDSKGCTKQTIIAVSTTAGPSSTPGVTANASCNASCNGTATINVSGGTGPYTYSWITNPSITSTANNLCAGTYTCIAKDGNGCTTQQIFNITQPAVLAVAPSSTSANCGGTNGSATGTASGGTGPYTYAWTPAPAAGQTTPTAINLSAGNYTVTVTDSKGCTQNTIVPVNNVGGPSASVASSANPTCNASCNGTATVTGSGGTAPLTYSWTSNPSTTGTANNLCAGTSYICTVKDAAGCSTTQTITLTQPAALSISPASTNTSCNAVCDGTATATVSGGTSAYTYSWSPNTATTPGVTALCQGTYTCHVTDANGCPTQQVFTITQPAPITDVATTQKVLCNGACNGSATVVPSGGTGAFTYAWVGSPSLTQTASSLCAGTYTCTMTDAHGCSKQQILTIIQPSPLTASDVSTSSTCNLSNGSMNVTPSGGTATYTYAWSPAPATGTVSGNAGSLPKNSYTCTVTDSAGCTFQVVDSVKNTGVKPVALITPSGPTTFCFGNPVTLTASGGSTYSWNTGSAATSIVAGTGGTFTLYAINSCGVDSTKITLIRDSLPKSLVTGPPAFCKGSTDILNASGGGTYVWSTGATTSSIVVSTGGPYYVLVTNNCGTDTAHFNVTENTVQAGFIPSATTGTMPLPITFADSSSANSSEWDWNYGDGTTSNENTTGTGAGHTYATGGNYTVTLTVTDTITGCTSTYSRVIVIKELPSWIKVPNVFTPNDDGSNDLFVVSSQGISKFEGKIYDRWGVELITLTAAGMGWDGRTPGGALAVPGTYFYIITASGDDGRQYAFNGSFMLIRN